VHLRGDRSLFVYTVGMSLNKFTLPHDFIWKRPDEAFFDAKEQAEGIDPDEIEWDGKYKQIRELRDIAIFGSAMYDLHGTPFWVQLNTKNDSPDAFVMRQSPDVKGDADIGAVELTFYGRNRLGLPKKSLADKLSEPKGKFSKLPDQYCLVILIGKGLEIDHLAVTEKMKAINAKFQIFSIQEVTDSPDTTIRFVVYSPVCKSKDINIGEVWDKQRKDKVFGTMTQTRGIPKPTA